MAIGIANPAGGVRDRRKLSCDDYNPAHVESGRLEGFPVMGAFVSSPTAVALLVHHRAVHGSPPDCTVWAACLRANKVCSNSTGGQ
jgi:hypothetical protein